MADVRTELEQVREELLDLTLRNPLLSYRAYSRSTVSITDEIPREVFHRLVIQNRRMEFLAKQDQEGLADTPIEGRSEEDSQLLWQLPPPGVDLADKHTDRFLATAHTERDLQKRLFHIDNKARTLIEDAGYNALHLAVGFLSWIPEDHDEARLAPLVLIPVQIEREKAKSAFKVAWNGQDLDTNLSLQLKLQDHGVDLPGLEMPEDKDGLYAYLQAVDEAVAGIDGWEVVPRIELGFFKFTNLSMYKDLDPAEWPEDQPPWEHPLVRAILDPAQAPDPGQGFPEDEVDQRLSATDTNHVLDADPSQMAVIEDVKAGRNLVVEGPPGTGKSQTIVNLIAELMAQDKTVLFVSEKLAALEVVHGKLAAVGLDDFCLEVHSHKANKAGFLNELERVALREPMSAGPSGETYQELDRHKEALNAYARALRTPVGQTGLAPYELVSMKEASRRHMDEGGLELPLVDLDGIEAATADHLATARAAIEELIEAAAPIWPPTEHPWQGTRPGAILPRKLRRVREGTASTDQALERLREERQRLVDRCHLDPPASPTAIEDALSAAELVAQAPEVELEVVLHPAWDTPEDDVKPLVDTLEAHHDLQASLDRRFRDRALTVDAAQLRERYRDAQAHPLRWLTPGYWQARARVRDLYQGSPPRAPETLLEDLADLCKLQELTAEIEDRSDRGEALFGRRWDGVETDPAQLRGLARWLVPMRKALREGPLTEATAELVADGVEPGPIEEAIEATREALARFQTARTELFDLVDAEPTLVLGHPADQASLDEHGELLGTWQASMDRLDDWATYVTTLERATETPLAPVAQALHGATVEPDHTLAVLDGNLADALLQVAFDRREALAGFAGDLHEKKIRDFAELDRQALELNRQRVAAHLWETRPRLVDGASGSSEAGILVREFRKSRRHLSIRKLMIEAGAMIQELKPCFLMSPLSVAKYLDPQKVSFDVVVFDEASQIRPQDALGAILRGSQVVVMGDAKQLPPTSFFDTFVERDEEVSLGSVVDLPSILDACEGALPKRMLRWHYRSRHASLITVSNQAFYDGRLVVYPSPYQSDPRLGLALVHLPDTVYDRGGSRMNRGEARAIAEAALEHFRQHPDQSLGIGTFSAAQEEAIREEIEITRRQHPEMDPFFTEDESRSPHGHEHFMVKNLETIQGDERDVIFVSVGYGYDHEGRFTTNFGPVNHDGGWRRLNVLMTRARNRCVVFSNVTADDLELGPDAPRGVRALEAFLEHAAEQGEPELADRTGRPEAAFPAAVHDTLREAGYEVHTEVGTGGFRLDLAVVDPEDPGRYLLGIELDGPGYHGAKVARERDRLRRQVLEERGWNLHRVWSTDWYRSPATAQRRLVETVEAAEAGPRATRISARGRRGPTADQRPDDAGTEAPDDDQGPEAAQEEPMHALTKLEELGQPYEACHDPTLPTYDETAISEGAPAFVADVADGIEQIVQVEGPVHRDVVAARLRDAWGLDRAGQRLKGIVDQAIDRLVELGQVEVVDGFLRGDTDREVPVRRRGEGVEAEISLICDEEIRAAVELVLGHQFATPPGEIERQVAVLLGFQRTGQRISQRVSSVVQRGLKAGALERLADGRVQLAEDR